MTTATAESSPETSTSTQATPSPASTFQDLADVFYGDGKAKASDSSKATDSPAAKSENGHSASPDKATAASTEAAKKDESSNKGTETEKDATKEQLAAQRAANGRLGKEVQELKTQFEVMVQENRDLKARLDGTYKEPPKPDPEVELDLATFKGKEEASRSVAIQLFGEETLKEKVYGPDSAFANLVKEEVKANKEKAPSWSFLEVKAHPQPAVKAMHILHRAEFEKQYGEDPTKWQEKIEAELRPKIMEEFKKQAATPLTGDPAPTVSEARGSAGSGQKKTKSMEELFYGPNK